jgi:hypothetical protein
MRVKCFNYCRFLLISLRLHRAVWRLVTSVIDDCNEKGPKCWLMNAPDNAATSRAWSQYQPIINPVADTAIICQFCVVDVSGPYSVYDNITARAVFQLYFTQVSLGRTEIPPVLLGMF